MMSLSASTLSLECFLLLFLCLWFWPGTSRVPRLLAALLIGALTLPIYLLWSYSIQAYYRLRLALLERKLERLERQMQADGMNLEEETTSSFPPERR
jgi:membrane-bound acyltransferase YfiQ involved in biofilm formation